MHSGPCTLPVLTETTQTATKLSPLSWDVQSSHCSRWFSNVVCLHCVDACSGGSGIDYVKFIDEFAEICSRCGTVGSPPLLPEDLPRLPSKVQKWWPCSRTRCDRNGRQRACYRPYPVSGAIRHAMLISICTCTGRTLPAGLKHWTFTWAIPQTYISLYIYTHTHTHTALRLHKDVRQLHHTDIWVHSSWRRWSAWLIHSQENWWRLRSLWWSSRTYPITIWALVQFPIPIPQTTDHRYKRSPVLVKFVMKRKLLLLVNLTKINKLSLIYHCTNNI